MFEDIWDYTISCDLKPHKDIFCNFFGLDSRFWFNVPLLDWSIEIRNWVASNSLFSKVESLFSNCEAVCLNSNTH